jgi:hypothetical protein
VIIRRVARNEQKGAFNSDPDITSRNTQVHAGKRNLWAGPAWHGR